MVKNPAYFDFDDVHLVVFETACGEWIAFDSYPFAAYESIGKFIDVLRPLEPDEITDQQGVDWGTYWARGNGPEEAINLFWERLDVPPEPNEVLQRIMSQLSVLAQSYEELAKEVKLLREKQTEIDITSEPTEKAESQRYEF